MPNHPYRSSSLYNDILWQRAVGLAKHLADLLCDPKLDPQKNKELQEAFRVGWVARELNQS